MAVAGKVVLVTGAARGMGREYVRGFVKEGARVIAADVSWSPTGVSNDDASFLDEIAGRPEVMAATMDITIDSHVKRVYNQAMERFGTIDVIVNNAGLRQRDIYPPHGSVTTLETEVGDWQRMFDTHVFGTLRVIKSFVQPMLGKGRGSIISVGSDAADGSRPDSREMPYKAAKAGLMTMAMYLSHELESQNIAVNVLLPGHTYSTGSEEQEAERKRMRAHMGLPPIKPVRMRPEHVVPLALHLADQDAGSLTGQIISAVAWNEEHGLGGRQAWANPADLD